MNLYLGIDTSAYTTSLCLVDAAGQVAAEARQVLTVPHGKQGLRQSEAVFQHVRNLPQLAARLREQLGSSWQPAAVAATAKPRPQPDSYMPVFVAGHSFGASYAHIAGVPFYELSHQENHILSGMHTGGGPKSPRFLAIHLSGGTTELAQVTVAPEGRMSISLLGGTSDLHAGQFVDRIGVALGLPFPAGPALEKLAVASETVVTVPAVHKDGELSFSGPLTALLNQVEKADPGALARGCLECIGRALVKWIKWAETQTPCRELLLVGGVAANQIVRQLLKDELTHWDL
jgi:N6-L-threonylcarbamoyladenine synthase